MQWSASDRARGVMIRPAVHRRPGLFGTSIGTSFAGFLGIVLRTPPPSQPIPTGPVLLVLTGDQSRAAVARPRFCCDVAVAAVAGCLSDDLL